MPFEYVVHRAAVRDDIAAELPGAAQHVLQQEPIGASRLAVHRIIGAHDRARMAFGHGRPERGQIGILHVMLTDVDVGEVPCRFGATVHGIMLRRRNRAIIMRIVALHSGDVRNRHAAGQERILAVGFLSPAPARIPKDVHVGRPEIEPFHRARIALLHRFVVLDAAFDTDRLRHLVNGRSVECGGERDRLGEFRRAFGRNSVKRLAPPVVSRNSEPRNRARVVDELRGLFLQRHAAHQVLCPNLRRERGVLVGSLVRMSCTRGRSHGCGACYCQDEALGQSTQCCLRGSEPGTNDSRARMRAGARKLTAARQRDAWPRPAAPFELAAHAGESRAKCPSASARRQSAADPADTRRSVRG
jgi:hypothetical protein